MAEESFALSRGSWVAKMGKGRPLRGRMEHLCEQMEGFIA